MNEPSTLKFSCPQCRQPVQRESAFFPFCSKRCHITDLGHWAAGDYRIAGEPTHIPDAGEQEGFE